jgi:DNA-directed RNA polymerase subunit beta'
MKEKFGSPFGYGVYFRGGMGAEAIRELLAAVDLQTEAKIRCARPSRPPRARSCRARKSSA